MTQASPRGGAASAQRTNGAAALTDRPLCAARRRFVGQVTAGALGALMASALPTRQARAQVAVSESVVRQLRAQGFEIISVDRTWLGRIRIRAQSSQYTRELVYVPSTGEVLRDYFEPSGGGRPGTPANGSTAGNTGNAGNSGSRGNSGNGGNGGRGNDPGGRGNSGSSSGGGGGRGGGNGGGNSGGGRGGGNSGGGGGRGGGNGGGNSGGGRGGGNSGGGRGGGGGGGKSGRD